MPYSFLRAITVDHLQVGGTVTFFPVCIDSTLLYLRTVGNGGDVQNANGFDIIFISDPNDESSLLNWEVEKYTATSGLLVAWVRIPVLSSAVDTVFYMKYGNAAITTFQGNVTGTWKTEFKAVWHLPGNELGVIPPDMTDSTINANNGASSGLSNEITSPGQVEGGCFFSGGGTGITCGTGASLELQTFTISGWFEPTGIGGFGFGKTFLSKISDFSITTSSGWGIYARGSDSFLCLRYFDSTIRDYISTFAPVNSTRYYLAMVRDRGAGEFRVYVNGILVSTIATTTDPITYASDVMNIGGPPGDTAGLGTGLGPYQGLQDEVRLFDGAQAVAWLLTEYNNQLNPPGFYTISQVSTPFTASCGDPPDGTAGIFYTHTFPTPVDGGLAPFIFAIVNLDDETFVPEDVLNNITLGGLSGIWAGYPAVGGTYTFRLLVVDATSREEQVDCTITIADGVAVPPPEDWLPVPPINPPDGWNLTEACSRTGNNGVSHVADGTVDGSNARMSSLVPIEVEAGWTLYVSFWAKSSGGADGTIGFGFMFYDADDVFLSEEFITTDSFPTSFTQFQGTIVVPAEAVSAVAVIQVIDHLVDNSVWCIDDVYAIRSGGHFILSSIKHYFDEYTLYR